MDLYGKKKILVVSPTPSHPQNAGNRARIYRMLKSLKEQGHEIHFLNADREYAANHVKKGADIGGMMKDWDRFFNPPIFSIELPAFLTRDIHIPFWKLKQPFYPIIGNLWRIKKPFQIIIPKLWILKKPFIYVKSKLWILKKPFYPFWWVKKPFYPIIGNLWRLRIPFYYLKSSPSRIIKFISPSLYEKIRPVYRKLFNKKNVTAKAEPIGNQIVRDKLIKILNTPSKSKSIENPVEEISQIDEWYNFKLDKFVRKLHKKHNYDAVLCEYVFMSRVLNNFGNNVLKIIDTHDVFANRNEKYAQKGLTETFFSTTVDEEKRGLSRADKIIAIQDEERQYFKSLVNKDVVTIGHTVELQKPEQKTETNKNILYIGTGNIANIKGIKDFINNVFPLIKNKIPESKLILAGHICKHIGDRDGVVKLGEVKKITDAYEHADIVINPGDVGTGLKIKNIEALGLGKILITSSHSAEGLGDQAKNPFIIADTPDEVANTIINVINNVGIYNDTAIRAYEFAREYNEKNSKPLENLLYRKDGSENQIKVTDIKILPKEKTRCIIFTFPRTGSSTLRKLFDLHPKLSCVHEPFNKNLFHIRNFSNFKYGPKDINNPEKLKFVLDNIFKSHNCIKHLDVQLTTELNKELLKYPNCKIIFLWRKNLLQRLISNYISTKAQYWHSDTNVILKKEFEPIPVKKLQKRVQIDLEEVNKWKDFIKANTDQYYELAYEDIYDLALSEDQKIEKLNELFSYLGVGRMEDERLINKAKDLLNPQKTKLNSELTYKLIPNIQKIEKKIGSKETGYIFSK